MSILYGNILSWGSIILIVILMILSIAKKFERTKIAINMVLFLYGLLGSLTYPSYFLMRLGSSIRTDKQFIDWASMKFYNSITTLAIITTIVIVAAMVILIFYHKYASWVKVIMVFSQIFLIVIGVMISFNTINKIFDIAKYISGTAYYNALVLLAIPLIDHLIKKNIE
ncbi:MAG: hypothetical protein MJA31_16425 [Clostridia bacterium]|nr:hypothetical protein [Clostridia bacterium]